MTCETCSCAPTFASLQAQIDELKSQLAEARNPPSRPWRLDPNVAPTPIVFNGSKGSMA